MANATTDRSRLYAGLSGITMNMDEFDLGHEVRLRRTYAHLMSPCMIAFKRAAPGSAHPAPWKAAKGGYGHDVEAELSLPRDGNLPSGLSADDALAWISALLRLLEHPYMLVPVLSNGPLGVELADDQEGQVWPHETKNRIVQPAAEGNDVLSVRQLEWMKERWVAAASMYAKDAKFRLALLAVDECMVQGKVGSALLGVWGALEDIFLPGRNELRYRIASNLAAYLEEPGEARLKLFKEVLSLYDSRSRAAHSSAVGDSDALLRSFVLARNALIRMVGAGSVPTQEELERRLFCPS